MFVCPHCRASLEQGDRVWRCEHGHSFDVARQGYVTLEASGHGDTAEMVAAREAFLGAGYYAPIAQALVAAAPDAGTVVDLGAGTGYYLAAVLEARPDARGVALDASRPALRRAMRAHPRVIAGVACDIWRALPLQDGVADVLINVFAPRNAGEMRRVLAPGGTLLVVTPTERHLAELDLLRVHPGKRERLHEQLSAPEATTQIEYELALSEADVAALIAMGPSAHHDVGARGAATVTVSVVLETYRG